MDNRGKKFYLSQLFPAWDKPNKSDYRVQLNPRTAVAQSEARLRMQSLVSLTAVVLVFLGLIAANSIKQKPIDIQASFDFKKSLSGSIASINASESSFVITYLSSQDQTIQQAMKKTWQVQLIPGKSITTSRFSEKTCFLIDDLAKSPRLATPADCRDVVTVGRTVLMDYVFLNIPQGNVVVRSIIGKK
jgi:hypothetical protein